ncbi:MAG TPA: class III extradiol ring-cleavage dioxygenase [Vineibacter sp.]|nr:class III extradiol ring-cleavage dioxygenase [Vineibacter sp.]
MTPMLPIFVSHGAPTLILEDVPATRFLRSLGDSMAPPRAILAVSAHWLTATPAVSGTVQPETIHDFYGFPRQLYELRYPAPGAPDVARRVVEVAKAAGVDVEVDPAQGLDHGAWVPAMMAWPAANIPILQLAVQPEADAGHHYALGRALAPLAAEGVLVMGSGSATHNLRTLERGRHEVVADWARAYDDWLAARIEAGDVEALLDWRRRAPNAQMAHPTDEHFLPLFVALGAAGEHAKGRALHRSFMHGALSMSSFAFGA